MTFTILYPTVGVVALAQPSAGYGLRCRVQSNNPFTSGDFIWGRLLRPGMPAGIIIEGIGFVSGGSQQADIIWGWDTNRAIPALMQLSGPDGFYLATQDLACDVRFEYYNAASVIQDTQTFPLQFLHDPITGAGRHTLQRLWDQAEANLQLLLNPLSNLTFRTAHAGLTGTGTFSANGVTGVRLTLTTVPAVWGHDAATPRRLIPSVGSVQWARGSDVLDCTWLHYDHQLIPLERDLAWVDTVRYNLRPGVVATLQLFDRS